MVTPQTNTTLEQIAERLGALDDFVICGHVNPDGDCLGAGLGLYHGLRALGKKVVPLLAKSDPIDRGLRFLPGIDEMVVAETFDRTPKVFIAVDVPSIERLGTGGAVHDRAEITFTIDHHACDISMAQYNYVDPDASAAALLVWKLLGLMGAINQKSAECCMTGLITDTGRFAYQNTNEEAFLCAAEMFSAGADPALVNREFFQNRSLASFKLEELVLERMEFFEQGAFVSSYLCQTDFVACNAIKADAEVLIDELRSIAGVRVALILRENDLGEVRGSMRAKDDHTDVAQVAREFGGGGHKAAAGFTYHGSLEDARRDVQAKIIELCFGGAARD